MHKIVFYKGDELSSVMREVPLGARTTFGKSETCTLRIIKAAVSEFQAEVIVEDGKVTLINHSATNRTLFKGKPMTEPIVLQDGDLFDICGQTLKYTASKGTTNNNTENIPPNASRSSVIATPVRKAVKSSSATPAKTPSARTTAPHQATPAPKPLAPSARSSQLPISRSGVVARKKSAEAVKAVPSTSRPVPASVLSQRTVVATPQRSIIAANKTSKTPRAVTFAQNGSPVQTATVEVVTAQPEAVAVAPIAVETVTKSEDKLARRHERVKSLDGTEPVSRESLINALATPKKKKTTKKSKIMVPITRTIAKTPSKVVPEKIELAEEEVIVCGVTEISTRTAFTSPVKAEISERANRSQLYHAQCPQTPRTKFIIGDTVPTPVDLDDNSSNRTPTRSAPRLGRTPKTKEVDIEHNANSIFENTNRVLFSEDIEPSTAVQGEVSVFKSAGVFKMSTPMRQSIFYKANELSTVRAQSQVTALEEESDLTLEAEQTQVAAEEEVNFTLKTIEEIKDEANWDDGEADQSFEATLSESEDDISSQDEDATSVHSDVDYSVADVEPTGRNYKALLEELKSKEAIWSGSEDDSDYNAEDDEIDSECSENEADDELPCAEVPVELNENKKVEEKREVDISEEPETVRAEEQEISQEKSEDEKEVSFQSAEGDIQEVPAAEADSIYESAEESEEVESTVVPEAESEKPVTIAAEKETDEKVVVDEETVEESEEESDEDEDLNIKLLQVWEMIREEKDEAGDRLSRKLFRLPARSSKTSKQYYQIVADPIDLTIIKKKITVAEYGTVEEFCNDMQLLFNNALLWDKKRSTDENTDNVTALRIILSEQLKEMFDYTVKVSENSSASESEQSESDQSEPEPEVQPKSTKKIPLLQKVQLEISMEEADETAVTTPRTRKEYRKNKAKTPEPKEMKVESEEESEEEDAADGDDLDQMIEELGKLRVVDLRAELKKKGLSIAGLKAELVLRLAQFKLGK